MSATINRDVTFDLPTLEQEGGGDISLSFSLSISLSLSLSLSLSRNLPTIGPVEWIKG